ncbi:MAG: peptide chain release factor N(5)-glutamine methyltransferase [Nocardioidaceae bacterium]
MSSRERLAWATRLLSDAGVASPRVDAELLLASVLDVPRGALGSCAEPDDEQAACFRTLVRRRADRVPLQHLLGTAAFRHVELEVGPGVFTPRPETELLAGWGIEQLRAVTAPEPILVDLCTGSGAIAKAVADELPGTHVVAVELSSQALEYAGRNLAGTGVDLRAGDIAEAAHDLDGAVHVVLANPPYIPVGEFEAVAVEARDHDPAVALWSGADGLTTVRVVEVVARRLLRPGGVVGCEHADVQGESVPALFAAAQAWSHVRDHADLTGRPRFTTATRR